MSRSAEVVVRPERPDDIETIRVVNLEAFGRDAEGGIVDELRSHDAVLGSLVATLGGAVVGYILFSPVTLGTVVAAGLGPMAVRPAHQRNGIGSLLVSRGNEMMRRQGLPFIAVLGHPTFYPKFGFVPASRYGLNCQWEVPDDAFMIKLLDGASLQSVPPDGVVRYRPEFMV